MIYLKLTHGRWTAIDDEDFEWLSQWRWGWQASRNPQKSGYAIRRERLYKGGRKKIYLHRFIMNCPVGLVVDHRDRNGLNNQKYNLERTNTQQNNLNRTIPIGLTSKYRGVDKKGNKFIVRITCKRERIYLGSFSKEDDAARTYDAKAFELFCEFAELNFPLEYRDKIPSEAIPF